jgi:uncharacterized protein YgbK (DUF1537 family)
VDFNGLSLNELARPGMEKIFFVGDDFTGASDNAAQYSRHGQRTVLLFALPDAAALRTLMADNDVVGIATAARSMRPHDMVRELAAIFDLAAQAAPDIVQYKCCSTFDSSPDLGNLAVALGAMRERWPGSFSPIYAATPEFGRYTVFSNHYAVYGQARYRLDRHPVMAHHPATPMDESDLRQILARQGLEVDGAMDLTELDRRIRENDYACPENAGCMVFDSYTLDHAKAVARLVLHAARRRTVTALAAQGLAEGIGRYLAERDGKPARQAHRLPPADRILVLCGSCSEISRQQIEHARRQGFRVHAMPPVLLADGDAAALEPLAATVVRDLNDGHSVVVHTALGPRDPAIAQLDALIAERPRNTSARYIGRAFSALIRRTTADTDVGRFVVAGGDCASYTMTALGAQAIEMTVSHFAHNAHFGRVRAADPRLDGKEFLLKGGQVGAENLYDDVLRGF